MHQCVHTGILLLFHTPSYIAVLLYIERGGYTPSPVLPLRQALTPSTFSSTQAWGHHEHAKSTLLLLRVLTLVRYMSRILRMVSKLR